MRQGMDDPEKTFQVLDTLDTQEILTQRQLADHAGISLGQVNYILKSLLERGLVKIGNFRKNTHKIGYMYLLTPKGIEAKSRLAVKFIVYKLNDGRQNSIRQQIPQMQKELVIVFEPIIRNTEDTSLVSDTDQ